MFFINNLKTYKPTEILKNVLNQMTLRIQKHIDDSYIPLDIVRQVCHPKASPWILLKPEKDTSFSDLRKLKQPLLF